MELNTAAYVGLDVHKDTIAVAIAKPGRGEAWSYGVIDNSEASVKRLLDKLAAKFDGSLAFCYEAGPCGYGLYRRIIASGHRCLVAAPSLMPRRPGDRVKTDRRDALNLARLHRGGELTAVWVPDAEREAMRDLVRARQDMKSFQRQARQRLLAFLLRHDRVYDGGTKNRTLRHKRWLEEQRFEHPAQQVVFQEYLDMVKDATRRVASLKRQMEMHLQDWSMRPVVEALISLRGVSV